MKTEPKIEQWMRDAAKHYWDWRPTDVFNVEDIINGLAAITALRAIIEQGTK